MSSRMDSKKIMDDEAYDESIGCTNRMKSQVKGFERLKDCLVHDQIHVQVDVFFERRRQDSGFGEQARTEMDTSYRET